MRHGKKPTKAQREFLRSYNLAPEDWLIVKNTSTEMELISRFTGRKQAQLSVRGRKAPHRRSRD